MSLIDLKEKWNSGKFDINDKKLTDDNKINVQNQNPVSEGSPSSGGEISPMPKRKNGDVGDDEP